MHTIDSEQKFECCLRFYFESLTTQRLPHSRVGTSKQSLKTFERKERRRHARSRTLITNADNRSNPVRRWAVRPEEREERKRPKKLRVEKRTLSLNRCLERTTAMATTTPAVAAKAVAA